MKKEKDKNQPHQGSVSAEDNGLMTWLHSFWARKEPPEKLEVWLLSGPAKDIRQAQIHHADFKPNEDKNQEQCAHMANELVATMQHDCNTTQRRSWYEVAVIDRHRSVHPITRKVGPLFPEKVVALAKNAPSRGGDEDDDDEITLSGKPMSYQYAQQLISSNERREQMFFAVFGDILMERKHEAAALRARTDQLEQRNMQMFMAIQAALDQQLDREERRLESQVKRAREQLIADGMREAGEIVKIYAPRLIGALTGNQAQSPPRQTTAMQPAKPGAPSLPDHGQSEERMLVEQFLGIIAKAKDAEGNPAHLDEKMLGDWIETTDGLQPNPDKPGILTPDQVRLLVDVSKGWIDPSRVDELDPSQGHANAISEEQMLSAQAILPQSAGAAIFELLAIRAQKRIAANQTTKAA